MGEGLTLMCSGSREQLQTTLSAFLSNESSLTTPLPGTVRELACAGEARSLPVVSLSVCTHSTLVLPKPFLTPKEQTSDLGLQNSISTSRVCLSYAFILATWARPGDHLTPDSGGDGSHRAFTVPRHGSLAGQARRVRTSSTVPSFRHSSRVWGMPARGPPVLTACVRDSAHGGSGPEPPKPILSVLTFYP